ncbi:MAG: pyridoxal kinase PdxY [Treponema sp.]|nr:pyridoxal kinase PdxY [Treponema sp.]
MAGFSNRAAGRSKLAVLSIQSHVVYGYAGNTAAVFPLQRLGNEVWAVNTVEFSNHTGYGTWRGKVLGSNLVSDLVSGLEERDVLKNCSAVLSGYLGDAEVGKAVIDAVKKTKKHSPAALYACDPVMGDTGRGFYVKPDIPKMFKEELLPLADIICPNHFELEVLTGNSVKNIEELKKSINLLHEKGPSVVLVTSVLKNEKSICMIASDKNRFFKVETPFLPLGNDAAGTGDMTTAVFLSHFLKTKNIALALELCASGVFSVLESSYKLFLEQKNGELIELKIIEAQEQFVSPSHQFKAEEIL